MKTIWGPLLMNLPALRSVAGLDWRTHRWRRSWKRLGAVFLPKAPHQLPGASRQSCTHTPPCHRVLTDGSYSYYLTFIKRPQCAERAAWNRGVGGPKEFVPRRLWPHGGEGTGLSFPLRSLLLSANSSSSSRSPTGTSGQRLGQRFNVSETCPSCFVCDQQPELPRPIDSGDGKGRSLIQAKAMGSACRIPFSLLHTSIPQWHPTLSSCPRRHDPGYRESPWSEGTDSYKCAHSALNLEHLHMKKKLQQPRKWREKPGRQQRWPTFPECLQGTGVVLRVPQTSSHQVFRLPPEVRLSPAVTLR